MRSRRHERERIAALDPERNYFEIFRFMATRDLGWEHRSGLNLAFYRIFAVPHMAKLLVHTGHIQAAPIKRTYDTGLLMYDLSYHGPEHPRGREVIRKINAMHRRWDIANEDHLYVLSAIAVLPLRFMDDFGWRSPTRQERQANFAFYRRVGELLGIRELPSTGAEFERLFDEYEAKQLAFSDEGRQLFRATQTVVADWFPGPLGVLADPFTKVILGDEVSRCLGQTPAPTWTRGLVRGALTVRRLAIRHTPIESRSLITPGDPVGPYESGYALDVLGAEEAVATHGSSLPSVGTDTRVGDPGHSVDRR